jgi:hypothetical protein
LPAGEIVHGETVATAVHVNGISASAVITLGPRIEEISKSDAEISKSDATAAGAVPAFTPS